MAFDVDSTPTPSGSVLRFPDQATGLDHAPGARLIAGEALPGGVVRLGQEGAAQAATMTPEQALLRAIGRALPVRVRAKVMEGLWLAYVVEGDQVAGQAWEILTGRSK